MQKALFLDRDGVINIEKNYLYKIEDFEFIKGVKKALKQLQELGFLLIVVTNQSGIARGYYSLQDFYKLDSWMKKALQKENIDIKKTYFCPHAPPDNCDCRKPNPKMILDAKKEFNVDLKNSWLVGDKESDILAALNSGITNTILLRSGHKINEKNTKARFIANNLLEGVTLIQEGKLL